MELVALRAVGHEVDRGVGGGVGGHAGMVHALLRERIVLEGAGATPIALLLTRHAAVPGRNIVAVCSGDNVDMRVLLSLVAGTKEWP